MLNDIILSDDTFFVVKNGTDMPLAIRIHKPVNTDDCWNCLISTEGLPTGNTFNIVGMTELHAVCVTLKFLVEMVTGLIDTGKLNLLFNDGASCNSASFRQYFGFS